MRADRLRFAVAGLLIAVIAGCQPQLFRAETELHEDGSLRRAIYQPVEATLAAAQKPELWQGVTYARRIAPETWSGKIADLPRAVRDEKRDYFAAWGSFSSADRLPQAYLKRGPKGLPDGQLLVACEREDFVLLVEHRFRETLTDIVTIDDMHLARREMADLLLPLAQTILDEALGDEYDTTALVDWLHRTATPWFFELCDALFESGARKQHSPVEFTAAIAPVCARHGLVLTDESGEPLDDAAMGKAVEAYATRVLGATLRRRDGQDVAQEEIASVIEWIGLKERRESAEKTYQRYDAAAEKAIVDRHENSENFTNRLEPLIARILGLYASGLFGSRHEFHFKLTTPGPIVKTNGAILSDRSVRWTFDGQDAYPFGYTMECDSIVVRADLTKELLGRDALAENETAIEYVDRLRSNPALVAVMQACAREKSMAPYYTARDASAAASPAEEALEALGRLLELPQKPAKK